MSNGYLTTGAKAECFGCEACVQACAFGAITMVTDEEGFRYPLVDESICSHCGLCNRTCPYESMPQFHLSSKYAYGGYHRNKEIREKSTSGGAFSAIVDTWCDENYVIFGAESSALCVQHSYVTDKELVDVFRKSKYSQSIIGSAYIDVKNFLIAGKKVLFSGTPCQIAGLRTFLRNIDQSKLLTVEVVCEGVPSPLYMYKYDEWCKKTFKSNIKNLDYRFKSHNKWDFQVMLTELDNFRELSIDRWFNPFWDIWLRHLMSRPSCYNCKFACASRCADITLGDLWGVHIYCPELYGGNKGASLVVSNTSKGKSIVRKAESLLYGHELDFATALKYQGPMRNGIPLNPDRELFMSDLKSNMDYVCINKKWARKPTGKLVFDKYCWGNRQKVALLNLKKRIFSI